VARTLISLVLVSLLSSCSAERWRERREGPAKPVEAKLAPRPAPPGAPQDVSVLARTNAAGEYRGIFVLFGPEQKDGSWLVGIDSAESPETGQGVLAFLRDYVLRDVEARGEGPELLKGKPTVRVRVVPGDTYPVIASLDLERPAVSGE
jgi:hypothetical protein